MYFEKEPGFLGYQASPSRLFMEKETGYTLPGSFSNCFILD
jgi:hypothetical protein